MFWGYLGTILTVYLDGSSEPFAFNFKTSAVRQIQLYSRAHLYFLYIILSLATKIYSLQLMAKKFISKVWKGGFPWTKEILHIFLLPFNIQLGARCSRQIALQFLASWLIGAGI